MILQNSCAASLFKYTVNQSLSLIPHLHHSCKNNFMFLFFELKHAFYVF